MTVVLPLEKAPVTTVTGILLSARGAWHMLRVQVRTLSFFADGLSSRQVHSRMGRRCATLLITPTLVLSMLRC